MKKGLLTLGLLLSVTGLAIGNNATTIAVSGDGQTAEGLGCESLSYCPSAGAQHAKEGEIKAKRTKVNQKVQKTENGKAAKKTKAAAQTGKAAVQTRKVSNDKVTVQAVTLPKTGPGATPPAYYDEGKTTNNTNKWLQSGTVAPVKTNEALPKDFEQRARQSKPSTGSTVQTGPAKGSVDVVISGQLGTNGKTALMKLSAPLTHLSQPLLGVQKGRKLLGAEIDKLGFRKINEGLINLQKQVKNMQAKQFLNNLTNAAQIIATSQTAQQLADASLQVNHALQNLANIKGFKDLQQAIQLHAQERALRIGKTRPVLALLLLEPFKNMNSKASTLYNEILDGLTASQRATFNRVNKEAQDKLLTLKKTVR
jgi:hypothetical protein